MSAPEGSEEIWPVGARSETTGITGSIDATRCAPEVAQEVAKHLAPLSGRMILVNESGGHCVLPPATFPQASGLKNGLA